MPRDIVPGISDGARGNGSDNPSVISNWPAVVIETLSLRGK